jgi:hypothetical protein
MRQAFPRLRSEARQRRGASVLRLRVSRRWWQLRRRLADMRLRYRRAAGSTRPIEQNRTWRSRREVRVAWVLITTFSVLLIVAVSYALYAVIDARPTKLDVLCTNTPYSCSVLAGMFGAYLSVVPPAGYILLRLTAVRRSARRRARLDAGRAVDTAGSLIENVVGRDALCQAMIGDLHQRDGRPVVVVGTDGAGKTALLVRLTQLLADSGALPVPVRLNEAQTALDFRELALRRFIADTDAVLADDAEGVKVWRQLRQNGLVVVLADCLEEALTDSPAASDRDTLIRLAVHDASEQRLPLVIASRPQEALRELEATIVELEPLSEDVALAYLGPGHPGDRDQHLAWIVRTAGAAETPFYLEIARQLHLARLLSDVPLLPAGRGLADADQAQLRLQLMQTWMQGLIDGYFAPGVPLSREERRASIEQLSALACIGLRQDRLEVRFDDFEHLLAQEPPSPMITELRHRLGLLRRSADIRLAATRGARLGLVEARSYGVRFPHATMQAYLGSRLLEQALRDDHYRRDALERSGHQFLLAAVLSSRASLRAHGPAATVRGRSSTAAGSDDRPADLLWMEARRAGNVQSLYTFAAALQADSVADDPKQAQIADDLAEDWPLISALDQRTLDEAKLCVLRRLGPAARAISARRPLVPDRSIEPAYRQLYRIVAAEPSRAVRLQGAREIGAGGDDAFVGLGALLGPSAPAAEPPGEWELSARAWLAPLLAGSVTGAARDARDNLEQWVARVGGPDGTDSDPGQRLSLEVALAQGFRLAANRRRRHPHASPEARTYLAGQAQQMLARTRFWYSRLTLIHALCLWSLPDDIGHRSGPQRAADYAQAGSWLGLSGAEPEHPFVTAARKLAVRALETGQPERFIWVDESLLAATVGSRLRWAGRPRPASLWIPPSAGWAALHPHAQQLAADVLLLLNLAERGPESGDRPHWLQCIDANSLPPCLSGNRGPLDPDGTAGIVRALRPGSTCADGCTFRLCPYPPKGELNYRAELSEAFCRRQLTLITRATPASQLAPWQATRRVALARFWVGMQRRARA